jgi:hypothetical protein
VIGETPTWRVNRLVNDPTLLKPTEKQISATLSSVVRRRCRARSRRREIRYWRGVSPKTRRKLRLKCRGETFAAFASASRSSGTS